MMTRARRLVVVLMAALLAISGLASPAGAQSTTQGNNGRNQPLVSFGVMADIHINAGDKTAGNLYSAISQLYQVSPRLDAVVAVGDLTDSGYLSEYQKLMGIFNRSLNPSTKLILTIGNHETYNGLSWADSQKRFIEQTGMPSVNTHNVINGFHFIGLSYRPTTDDLAWLDTELAAAAKANPKAPIFVFFHYPLRDTVYGSVEWGMDNPAMYDILAKYPQAFTFSGHSHYAAEDPRTIMQKDFTALNTGIGLNYLELEGGRLQGNIPPRAGELAQDLIVNVYPNRVEIQALDVHAKKPAGDLWVVKLPISPKKFTYTADRDKIAPRWPSNPALSASATGLRSAQVSFNQARDNLMVDHYEIKAVNVATGQADRTVTAFSEFYYDPVPPNLSFQFDGLTPGSTYRIEVTAIDSFGNRSAPIAAEIKTDALELVGLSVNPATLPAGTTGTLNATVRNWGTAPASGSVALSAAGPVNLGAATVDFTVAPGETSVVPVPVTATGTTPAVATVTGTATVNGATIGTASVKIFANYLLGETFDELLPTLQPAVDEQIPFDGFTHQGPPGWTIVNAPTMPQGTVEWQGWSFTTPRFWVAADNQDRDKFTLGSGVIAVADPDEWDDRNSPASRGRFDSRLISPAVPVAGGSTHALTFDSHYLQEDQQKASVVAIYSDGSRQTLVDYGPNGENAGAHAMNRTVTRTLNVPAGADSVRLEFRMYDAGNNWYWGIDNVRLA